MFCLFSEAAGVALQHPFSVVETNKKQDGVRRKLGRSYAVALINTPPHINGQFWQNGVNKTAPRWPFPLFFVITADALRRATKPLFRLRRDALRRALYNTSHSKTRNLVHFGGKFGVLAEKE